MKKAAIFLLILGVLISCKQSSKTTNPTNEKSELTKNTYPNNIAKIFNVHGGIDRWNELENMYFEIEKPRVNLVHKVALKSRKLLLTMEHHDMGFDGENVWLHQKDTVVYKGNVRFYYNLMFYFYAMPYVLADDGIHYQDVEAISFEGKEYPGIKISYDAEIGESPDDEYVLYYDKVTHKMAWLAYTVTYFSKEKSKKFNLIRYTEWGAVNELQLPRLIEWYVFKDGVVGEKDESHGKVTFVNAQLSKEKPEDDIFKAPESATLVE